MTTRVTTTIEGTETAESRELAFAVVPTIDWLWFLPVSFQNQSSFPCSFKGVLLGQIKGGGGAYPDV